MGAQLVVIAGPDAGGVFPLSPGVPLLIGRGRDTGTRLTDPRVSRVHCEVQLDGSRVTLKDRGSNSGTAVNGQRVTEQPLRAGDVIRVGDTQLRLDSDLATPTDRPPPASPNGLPGERLQELSGTRLGIYDVGPLLAKGKSGLVFRAFDSKHGRTVALKVLWPEFCKDDEEVKRFVRAMKTMMPIHHVHLVSLYGAGKTGTYLWVAMEYVEGDSLSQVIQRIGTQGVLNWHYALRVAIHVSRALVFAHYHQIIHRDIAPQNILVQRSDQVTKLGDLMMAKALEGKLAMQITRPGELLGDVRYMSPERTAGGASAVDVRADIYSLGATVYALLTGRPPCEGRSMVETILKIRQSEPTPPRQLQPAVPPPFDAIVMKMIAKQPEERYQTAAVLLSELERMGQTLGVKV
jgi:serine/threonine protein kinase